MWCTNRFPAVCAFLCLALIIGFLFPVDSPARSISHLTRSAVPTADAGLESRGEMGAGVRGAFGFTVEPVTGDVATASAPWNLADLFYVLTNHSAVADTIRLYCDSSTMPALWTADVCIGMACYPTGVDWAMAPGQSDTVRVDAFPGSVGVGHAVLQVQSLGNPGLRVERDITIVCGSGSYFSVVPTGGNVETVAAPWSLADMFYVITNHSTVADTVHLYCDSSTMPALWTADVCIGMACYPAGVDWAMAPGQSDTIRVDAFPGSVGVGHAVLQVQTPDQSDEFPLTVVCGDTPYYTVTPLGGATTTVPAPWQLADFFYLLTNHSAGSDTIHLYCDSSTMPAMWTADVCIGMACYPAGVDWAMAAGQSDTIRVDAFPGSIGAGYAVLGTASLGDPLLGADFGVTVICGSATGVEALTPDASGVLLEQNAPNPVRTAASIRFSLPRADWATLRIHDVAGRTVRTLLDGPAGVGPHRLVWDGTDDHGGLVASGTYFYQLTTPLGKRAKTLILVR
ncbi:MAG: FlgD immunoglobulin-like domain containing protein [Gemmatimonadota bacterium]|jgi:hypothetical protein|nr:FlgD immunoglobulin-like domain containing protein [Gemmatimonadota bacterium]